MIYYYSICTGKVPKAKDKIAFEAPNLIHGIIYVYELVGDKPFWFFEEMFLHHSGCVGKCCDEGRRGFNVG